MPWTKEHANEARERGWQLCEVHDGKRWTLTPLPTGDFTKTTPHAPAVMRFLVRAAQSGDALSQAALKHVTQVNQR